MRIVMLLVGVLVGALVGASVQAAPPSPPAPSMLVVDAVTGQVLLDQQAGQPRHPASLTKLMTAYVALGDTARGRAAGTDHIAVSAKAAGQLGSRLGLGARDRPSLDEALRALIVRSANDAAVALAEHLAGSEAAFVERMNAAARDLGMTASRFRNATGMTVEDHVTTARDMAVLALALRRDFPQANALFAAREMMWKQQHLPTVNGFLTGFAGAEGLKTGFTCPAGYNLAALARREGRVVLGIILGAPERGMREAEMARALGRYLSAPAPELGGVGDLPNREGAPPDLSARTCVGGEGGRAPPGWALEVAYGETPAKTRRDAEAQLHKLAAALGGGRVMVVTKPIGGVLRYRGLIVGLREDKVIPVCQAIRARNGDCLVLTPPMVKGAVEEEQLARRLAAQ